MHWIFLLVGLHATGASFGADTYDTKDECLAQMNIETLALNSSGFNAQVPGAGWMKCIYTDKSVEEIFYEVDKQAGMETWRHP